MIKKIFFYLLCICVSQISAQIKKSKMDSVLHSIQKLNEPDSVKVRKLTDFSAKYRYTLNTKKLIEQAEKLSLLNKEVISKIDVLRAWGNYYYYNSEFEKSEKYFNDVLNLIDSNTNPLLFASIEYALSGVYREKGNVSLAIETLLNSKKKINQVNIENLSKLKKKKLITRQIILFNSLANFYNQIENFTEATYYYDEAFDKAIKIEPKINAGTILSNKGNLLINIGKLKEALETLNKAKQIKIEAKASEISVANTDLDIAVVLYKTHQYEKALKSIEPVIKIYKKYKNDKGIQNSLTIKGNILFEQKKYDEAIKNCEKAKQLTLKTKVLKDKEKACKCLANAYEKTGNFKKSLLNLKLYQQAKDATFNEKNIKKIAQLELQYTFEKEKQRQQLITEVKQRENVSTIKNLLFGIITLLLIIGMLFRFNYLKNRNNDILKEKNLKISETLAINEILLKETHHRVKNNLQIISSLLNMQSNFLNDEKSKQVIEDSQNRIKSMSLIHQYLYQGKHLKSVEISSYFAKLLENLCLSYGIDVNIVKVEIDVDSMLLDVDTAVPLGLILNELISNAFKHGVDKKNGYFSLLFKHKNDKELLLVVKDNGRGLKNKKDEVSSYGMKLIYMLSRKLRADINFIDNNGLEVRLIIKKFKIINDG